MEHTQENYKNKTSTPPPSTRWVTSWLTTISTLILLFHTIKPFLARELLLKYSIRLNKYELRTDIPTSCPLFDLTRRHDAIDYEQYAGIWYNLATNDPTQPSGLCQCDRYHWSYNKHDGGSFTSLLDIKCAGLGIFRMTLEGQTNVTGIPSKITEGSPMFGAYLIPGYILWVDDDYTATIRYFCTHNYLNVDVFSSIQIWTREPVAPTSERAEYLLKKAHQFLNFDGKYMDFCDHSDCNKLPSVSYVE